MKNKESEVMESGDYDQMLRAMFESCDTVGLGLLTPNDFDKLCKKLSIQEHSSLLSDVLFSETNKRKLLCYDTFRDTLILFLTGDPEFARERDSVDKDIDYNPTDVVPEPVDGYNPAEEYWGSENQKENMQNAGSDRTGSLCVENPSCFGDEELISEPDFESVSHFGSENYQNNRNISGQIRSSPDLSRRRVRSNGSPAKYRRYGRRSKPDVDLLGDDGSGASERPVVLREVQMDDAQMIGNLNNDSPENSPWKGVEVSFVSEAPATPICMEEQFTGEGNDEEWEKPDSVWMKKTTISTSKTPEDTVNAATSVLEAVWCRVVGDPQSDAMTPSQFGVLCSELGMEVHLSGEADITQLFSALDEDGDGYVTFHEFSSQMSAFVGNSTDDVPAKSNCDLNESNHEVFNNSETNCNQESVFSTSNLIENNSFVEVETPLNDVIPSRSMSATFHVVPSQKQSTKYETTPVKSDYNANSSSPAISEESRTPDSRGELSLDSDETSPLCPPVVPVEPHQLAHRGRRRRRTLATSNPVGSRYLRRKSSRAVPLPHYHPISIRRIDELPLSYLTEDNGRYVSLDSLKQCWEQAGLENSCEVFEALQVSNSDQTVSVEALSEVLDMELEQNLLQKAALILYKNGINHYRAEYEHERAERLKMESNIEHLTKQLQEQEERIEKAESKFQSATEEIDNKYKVKIRTLTEELTAAQETNKQYESIVKKNNDYDELAENYERSKRLCDDLKKENETLMKEKEDLESRLQEAEEASLRMRDDLEDACRGLAAFTREHATQKKQLENVLRMYESQAQAVQDHHDELFDRLQNSSKRWTPNRSRSPSSRPRSSAGSYKSGSPLPRNNDTSSYSSACSMTSEDNNSHHLSTVQLFVNETSSTPHFMTSSPTETPRRNTNQEPVNLMTANAFAFLTPSTTQAKSRMTPDLDMNSSFHLINPKTLSSS